MILSYLDLALTITNFALLIYLGKSISELEKAIEYNYPDLEYYDDNTLHYDEDALNKMNSEFEVTYQMPFEYVEKLINHEEEESVEVITYANERELERKFR